MLGGVFTAILVSAIWIAGQILLTRFRPNKGGFKAMFYGYLLSLPLVYLTYRMLPLAMPGVWDWLVGREHSLSALFHAYFGHLLIFFLYVECYYHIERSVTLRLLIEIRDCPGGEPTSADISVNYKLDEMVVQRLAALEANRYVKRSGEQLQLLARGSRFAAGVEFFSWLFQSKTQDERL
jgi:hypothetical protein